MELPQYTTRPNIVRIVVPKTLCLLLLGALFYFAIWLNLFLLKIKIPVYINTLIAVIIFVLLAIQTAITYIRSSRTKYFFFTDRIEYKGKKPSIFYFMNTQRIYVKRNILDRLTGTGDIILEPGFNIKFIANPDQIYKYTQALIQRIKSYYQQYR